MLENFIKNNRKLSVVVLTLFVALLIGLTIYGLSINSDSADVDSDNRQESGVLESASTKFSNYFFTISNPTGSPPTITIDTFSGYRNAAVEYIIDRGFSPSSFHIDFKNYKNPFEKYE